MPAHFENGENSTDRPPVDTKTAHFLPANFENSRILKRNSNRHSEGEDEVAFFSAKRWDRRNRADLIEFAIPCHDAHVLGSYWVSKPLRLTFLAAKSEDYTTAP